MAVTELSLVALGVGVTAGASDKGKSTPAVPVASKAAVAVEDLMKFPNRHRGQVRVEGVVSAVAPKQQSPMVCVPDGVETYRLPVELTNWAIEVTVLGPGDDGLFPSDVEFWMRDDRWHARLL